MRKDKDMDGSRRRAIHDQIDENLKRVYTSALTEELPDRFKALLDQLSAMENAGKDDAK